MKTSVDRAALERAAEAAARRVADLAPDSSADSLHAEALRAVEAICSPADPAADPPPANGGSILLQALRAELIAEWLARPVPPSPESVAATLDAIDRLEGRERGATGSARAVLPDGYEFAAGVAHDLRSPLTSILFLAETLLSGQSGEVSDTQRRQLGIIYSAALGLVSVASDIIELVRGGEGLTEREPMLFSVTEILESVRDIVRPMAEEKGLSVHLFPPSVDHRSGHPLALSRVLLNLTTNGLRYTDEGFVEISVRPTSPTALEFSVRDTGRGYDPGALATLYEPFRRTHDSKFGFSGTGLGLAISRKLVTAMGSTIEVETRPRWGTRFSFVLDLPPVSGRESSSPA